MGISTFLFSLFLIFVWVSTAFTGIDLSPGSQLLEDVPDTVMDLSAAAKHPAQGDDRERGDSFLDLSASQDVPQNVDQSGSIELSSSRSHESTSLAPGQMFDLSSFPSSGGESGLDLSSSASYERSKEAPVEGAQVVKSYLDAMAMLQLARVMYTQLEGQNWRWVLDDQQLKQKIMRIPEAKNYISWIHVDFARVIGHFERYRDILGKVYPDKKLQLNQASYTIAPLDASHDFLSMERGQRMKVYARLSLSKAQMAYQLIDKSGKMFFEDTRVKTLFERDPALKKELVQSGGWIHQKLIWVIKHLKNAEKNIDHSLKPAEERKPSEAKKFFNFWPFWPFGCSSS